MFHYLKTNKQTKWKIMFPDFIETGLGKQTNKQKPGNDPNTIQCPRQSGKCYGSAKALR